MILELGGGLVDMSSDWVSKDLEGGGQKSPGDFPIKIPGVSLCLLGVKFAIWYHVGF